MNQYPMKPLMDQMAQHGRYGDSMLVHMNPAEVQGIASLMPNGKLTINPVTGQPEAFAPFLGILASSLGSMAGTSLLAPTITGALGSGTLAGLVGTALGSGIGAGAGTLLATGDAEKAKASLLGGMATGALGAVPGLEQSTELANVEGAKTALADATSKIPAGGLPTPTPGAPLPTFGGGAELALEADVAAAEKLLGEKIKQSQQGVFGAFADAPMESIRDLGSMGFLVPTGITEGAKTAIDRERLEKAMYADAEAEAEKELQEAEGNIQRGYVAAQPDAVRGPSEYRKALSTYIPPYQYASQGGIVSLANGGQVQRLEQGGRAGASRAQAVLDEKAAQALESGDASSYLAYLQGLDQSVADYFAGTQGGEETPDVEDVPEVPTSGYRVDPATGATVYFDDTRPSLAREQGAGVPYNIGAISNPFGGGYMGGYGTMGNNPGYRGVDPITIQANLRGRYAVDRPIGYMPGFEPEFRHFQSDLENIQVPSRQYAPQAAGPVMGTPYFGTMVDPASYLDEIGRYYSDIGSYRPNIVTAQEITKQVKEEDPLDEEEVIEEEEVVTPPVIPPVTPPVTPPPPVSEFATERDLDLDYLLDRAQDKVLGQHIKDRLSYLQTANRPKSSMTEEQYNALMAYQASQGQTGGIGVSGIGNEVDVAALNRDAGAEALAGYQSSFDANAPEMHGEQQLKNMRFLLDQAEAGKLSSSQKDFLNSFDRRRYPTDILERRDELKAKQLFSEGGIIRMENGGQIPLGMESPSGIAQADQAYVDGRGIGAIPTEFSRRGVEKTAAEVPQQDLMVLEQVLMDVRTPTDVKDMVIMQFRNKHGERALEEAVIMIKSKGDPNVTTSGLIRGQGDGKSDSIMGSIGDQDGAIAVSDGEFIVAADVVSAAGNGSTEAGAEFFEDLSDDLRKGTTGTTKQTRRIDPRGMV